MTNDEKVSIIESQLRELYAQTVWSHKIQEKQSDIYRHRLRVCEFVRLATSALISSGIVASIFVDSQTLKIVTATISFVAIFLHSYMKTYDMAALADRHKETALMLLKKRNRLMSFLTDLKIDKYTLEEIIDLRDNYFQETESIFENALDASESAVKKAGIALKVTGDNTFTNSEIDSYLPLYAQKKEEFNESE